MTSFRFVHAADLHLGSPFRGLSVRRRELAALLQDASYRALSRLKALCLAERVDFALFAGDLFDQKDRSLRAQLALRETLVELERGGTRSFVVHGNHDPLNGDRKVLSWPASAKVFGPSWEEVSVERNGEVIARIQGVSYAKEQVTENLVARFSRQGPEFTVGLLHANVGGNTGHANYAPCSIADLADRNLDYWALGHVHRHEILTLPSGKLAVYPGNLQGRHPLEDGPKGCALVEVSQGRPKVRFVPLDPVRFHRLNLSIEGQKTLDALESRLEEMLDRHKGDGVQANAARLTIVGRGSLHGELSSPRAKEWEESLAERLSLRDPPWLLESIKRRTLSELPVESIVAGGGLPRAVWDEAVRLSKDLDAQKALLLEEPFQKLSAALQRAGISRETDVTEAQLLRAAQSALEMLTAEEAS